jgi:hypothetical protein
MKSNEEIIKIFKEKTKSRIFFECTIFFVATLFMVLLFTCNLDCVVIFLISIILFCCVTSIYDIYVRFYNLKSIKKGNYSICIKPTVGNVSASNGGSMFISVKDCDEGFGFSSTEIENFSHKVYCVTTKKGTYAVYFCKEDC